MALNWDVRDVLDSENVTRITLEVDDPNHGLKAGDKVMNPVTTSLIWACMAVDLPGITRENAGEFYTRLRFTERVNGPFLIRAVDPETGKRPEGEKAFITMDEVHAHIGLKANVAPKTRVAWLKRWNMELDAGKQNFESFERKQQQEVEDFLIGR